jgi:hypothetical protein
MPKRFMNKSGLAGSDKQHRSTAMPMDIVNSKKIGWLNGAPWLAGMGIAVGHVLTSSNCSIPKQGSCSACGSCVVALGSLTAWALIKQRSSDQPFYEQTTK